MKEALQNTQYESLIKTVSDNGIGWLIIIGIFVLVWKFLPKVLDIISSWVDTHRAFNENICRVMTDLSSGLKENAEAMSMNAISISEMAKSIGTLPCTRGFDVSRPADCESIIPMSRNA